MHRRRGRLVHAPGKKPKGDKSEIGVDEARRSRQNASSRADKQEIVEVQLWRRSRNNASSFFRRRGGRKKRETAKSITRRRQDSLAPSYGDGGEGTDMAMQTGAPLGFGYGGKSLAAATQCSGDSSSGEEDTPFDKIHLPNRPPNPH